MSEIKGCSFSRKGRGPDPPVIIYYAIVMQKSGSVPGSFALEHSIDNLVISYIRFNAYGNGMGTSLIASLATHRSISHYVASLLAPKSHSSRREQNASLIARSSSFVYANNGFRSSAWWPRSLGLRPCGGAGNPHPLRSTLIDVCLCKHQWRRSVLGFLLP